jgi:predicted transcriptional regulator
MSSKRGFGELEWLVLEQIRTRGESSVKEIQQALHDTVKYTTVMTVMSRLAEKGALERRRDGKHYLYRISGKEHPPHLGLVDKLKKRLFGGKSAAMIRYLIDSSEDVTEKDLDEMRLLLENHRKKEG